MEKRYDARRTQASWNPQHSRHRWKSAEVVKPKETQIVWAILSADTRRKSARREESNESGSRRVHLRFRKNLSGVARIRRTVLRTIVKMRFAEVLNPDGSLYVDNLRTRATDHFILAGNGMKSSEVYVHGFRYVETRD